MRKLVLATKNTGKVAEFERLLSEFAPDIKVLGLADFPDMPEVIESGSTLHENARLKAKVICDFSKLPALADDSGLFIDALGGQPGIYSARWAGYEGVDTKMKDLANINKVLEELKDVPKGARGAQFKAVVAFCRKNLDSSYLDNMKKYLLYIIAIFLISSCNKSDFLDKVNFQKFLLAFLFFIFYFMEILSNA